MAGSALQKAVRPKLDSFFEARIFNSKAELRWLNHDLGRGRAALISEDGKLDVFGGQRRKEEAICRSSSVTCFGVKEREGVLAKMEPSRNSAHWRIVSSFERG